MSKKTRKVIKILENFKNEEIDQKMIINIFKIQNLIQEAQIDGN